MPECLLTAADMRGRDILLLGEGDFAFAAAFAAQHPELCPRLAATDRRILQDKGVRKRVADLRGKGVLVGELDAAALPCGCAVTRVQFNCPCGDRKTPVPEAVRQLFVWCGEGGLVPGGTLHISLHGNQGRAQKDIQLPACAAAQDYVLHNANTTLVPRYPGYAPRRTNGGSFTNTQHAAVCEYVFHRGAAGVVYSVVGGVFHIETVHTDPVMPAGFAEPAVKEAAPAPSLYSDAAREAARLDFPSAYQELLLLPGEYVDQIYDTYGADDAMMAAIFIECCPLPQRLLTRFEYEEMQDNFWMYSGGGGDD
ncbi:hypothetical protein DIPPA_06534 [Diplonema papillatum]|nr:hypothetical protein DIPPA_06534 [Diplonema papillatum]|eukprot:gene8214-12672_t